MLGERVFPLGLGAVLIRGCNPKGFELDDLIRVDLLAGHTVELENGGEGFLSRLPVFGHGKFGTRVEFVLRV